VQLPGQRGYGMTSRMFSMPVQNRMRRSNPSPKPECTAQQGWHSRCHQIGYMDWTILGVIN
jgi:hypothetical protein